MRAACAHAVLLFPHVHSQRIHGNTHALAYACNANVCVCVCTHAQRANFNTVRAYMCAVRERAAIQIYASVECACVLVYKPGDILLASAFAFAFAFALCSRWR